MILNNVTYALQHIVPVDAVSVSNTAYLVQKVVYHQFDTMKYVILLLAF